MSEIRSVSVRLDADVAGYIAKMKLAGAETDRAFSSSGRSVDATNTKLTTTDRTLGKVDTSARKLDSSMGSLNRRMDDGGRSIDRYSGRLGVFLDLALALAPALAPIGAELVPATFALGGNLASVGIGAGVTLLAFHGLGDALTKFNKAALDPTAANLKAAQLAMDKLPPSAQRFVLELHRLGPEVQHLQRIAADGILPGARAGLRDLEGDLPLVRTGIRNTADELGTLARDTGEALSSRRWRPFIRFLGTETPAALDTLGRAGGHTLHGLATLLMGFGPTTREIDQGILNLARDFDHWATITGRSKGFQDFLDYLRENGPRVLDLLGQTAITFVDIGRAVAPLGGPTIDVLTKLLGIVDDIANSDLGTPLFAGVVAFRLYARVAQLTGVQVETSFKGMAAAPAQMEAGITRLRGTTSAWAAQTRADLGVVTRSWLTAGAMSERETTAFSASSGRLRSQLGTVAKAGGLVAGTAVLLSGTADKAGLANTATLALAGSLAGPFGAAAGGAVGALLDMRSASEKAAEGQNDLDRVIGSSTSTLDDYVSVLQETRSVRQKFLNDFSHTSDDNKGPTRFLGAARDVFSHPGEALAGISAGLHGNNIFDDQRDAANKALVAVSRLQTAYGKIATFLNAPLKNKFGADQVITNQQLEATATRAQPAMLALGISVDDLRAAAERNDGSLDHMTHRIVAWINRADTASGRTNAVAQAFAGMSNQTLTLDDRVQALSDSLDALLGPTLGLSAATDQYTKDLHTLGGELAHGSKTLKGNSDAALTNREAIRTRVSDLSDLIKAEAQAGASPEKLTRTLKGQRQALIDAGAAAGISRKEMRDYLDQLGLTPKLVQTAISLVGTDQAAGELRGLRASLEGLKDRTIHIHVRTDHIGALDTDSTGGHVATGHAAGGTVAGAPRWPYGDKVLRRLAPGEEVISNSHGQADKNRGALKAANRGARLAVIGGMASGGTVDRFHRISTSLTTSSSSHTVERYVETLPRTLTLDVDGTKMTAYVRGHSQSVYDQNQQWERSQSGG